MDGYEAIQQRVRELMKKKDDLFNKMNKYTKLEAILEDNDDEKEEDDGKSDVF